MTADPSNKGQHLYVWPLGFNLGLLLLLEGFMWPQLYNTTLALFLILLAVFNGLAGFIFLLFERRRDAGYAGGFFLSFLVLLLIGFGMCSKDAKNHKRVEAIEAPDSN